MSKNLFNNVLNILLGVFFLYFLFLGIDLPYVGPNAANFNDYSLIAKNYNLFGFWNTKFAQIVSVAKNLPDNPEYYLHHPPLLPILQAISFRIFGYGFWAGRLTVILFSIASIFLVYAISKILLNERYAMISASVYIFIPATTIFGKMIGQEPLVLFFTLSTVLFVLKYLNSKSNRDYVLIITSVFFGTLSDWPMVYFSLLISIYLFLKKEIKLALIILIIPLAVSLLFLFFNLYFMAGFSDITNAILVRVLGDLVGQSFWPLRWITIIIVRAFIYFNPIFVMFGIYFLLKNSSKFLMVKKNNNLFLITFIFFLFGLIHILLYPEGSFGHPYWIYYLIPFVVFSSSLMLYGLLKRNKFIFALIILFSILYLIQIQYWKYQQTASNVWRYSLAKQVNVNFTPYEPIEINRESAIDRDLIKYVFAHDVKIVDSISEINKVGYDHFLYSCMSGCSSSDILFVYLLNNCKSIHVANLNGEAYVFDLKTKLNSEKKTSKVHVSPFDEPQEFQPENKLGNIYRALKDFLNAPQI